jgi:hypothetical protein
MADTKAKARRAFDRFVASFKAKYVKVTDRLLKDREKPSSPATTFLLTGGCLFAPPM